MSIKSVALISGAIFLLMAGILQNIGQIYFMAAVVTAVAIVARLAVSVSLRGLRLERRVVDRVYEDDFVTVYLTVSNPSRLPKFFLGLEENLSPWLETEQAKFFIPVLWPGEKTELQYRCRAVKRGRLKLGPMFVHSTDPIGLLYRDVTLPDTASALVYPQPIEMPPHDLGGAVSFGGGMAERMARTGEGLDFHGIREYQPGDELRRIHWKAVARQQRLAVIEFQQSYTADIAIAVDLLRGAEVGEGKQTTLEYGIKIAASLARRALDNRASVTLGLQGASGLQIITCRREDDLHLILESLAEAEADGEMPVYSVVHAMRPQLSPGTALVMITADADTRLVGLAGFLQNDNIKLASVLLDASTFAPGQKGTDEPKEVDTEAAEASASANAAAEEPEKPRTGRAYESLAESLRRCGADAHIVSREDDLTVAVRRIMGGTE